MQTTPAGQLEPNGSFGLDPNDVITIDEACAIIGGNGRPISKATYYRGVARGIYPKPFKVGANTSRTLRSECLAVVHARIAARFNTQTAAA